MDLDAIVDGLYAPKRRARAGVDPEASPEPIAQPGLPQQAQPTFSAGTAGITPEPSIGERVVDAIGSFLKPVGDYFEKARLSRFRSVMDEPGTELEARRERAAYEASRPPIATEPTAPLIEPTGGTMEAIRRFLPQAGYRLGATGGRQLQYLADLAGAPETSAYLGREASRYERAAERRGLGLSDEPVVETGTRLDAIIPSPRDISSGLSQTVEQTPARVGQVLGAMTGSVPTTVASLAPFAAQVFGQAYGQGLNQGMDPGAAALYAMGQSATETVPEALPSLYFGRALPGLRALMGTPQGPAELAKFLVGGYAAEMTNEQLSTLGNWAVDYATRDPTATFERLKKDFQDTVKQTLVMVPAMAGVGAGTRLAAERVAGPAPQAESSLGEAASIDDIVDRIFDVPRETRRGYATETGEGTGRPLAERPGAPAQVPQLGLDRQYPAEERGARPEDRERNRLLRGEALPEEVTLEQRVEPTPETAAAAARYGLQTKRGTSDKFLGGKTAEEFEADVAKTVEAAESHVGHPRDWEWYADAGEVIREYARGDLDRQERLTRIVAAMSQRTGVDQNARNAVQMADAILRGAQPPITVSKAATDRMMALVSDPKLPFDTTQAGVGKKLQSFYRNLRDEVFGEKRFPHDVTVDRHIGRFYFGKEAVTPNEYDYAQAVVQEATRRHNIKTGETKLPRQMQARIWGHQINLPEAERARIEGRSFAPERAQNFGPTFRGLEQQITAEAVPSLSTELGRKVAALPKERQAELTREAFPIINGVLDDLGVDFARVSEGIGGYEGAAHPNAIISVPGAQLSVGAPMNHESATQVARALAFVLKQDAVPWFRADPGLVNDPSATQGVALTIASEEAEGQVFEVLKQIFGGEAGYTRIGDRLYVLNFTNLSNDDFLARLGQHEADLGGAGVVEWGRYGAETFYERNDWQADPQGDRALASATTGRSDLQARLRDRADAFDSLVGSFLEEGRPTVEVEQQVTLGQGPGPAPIFYSELAKQVSRGPNKATAEQWRGYIKGLSSKGVKAEEVEFSGILDYIEMVEDNPSISKDELISWLYDNGVRVSEKVLGEKPEPRDLPPLPAGFTMRQDDGGWIVSGFGAWATHDDAVDAARAVARQLSEAARMRRGGERFEAPANDISAWVREANDTDYRGREETQYNQYTQPGAKKGYRELLITLPLKKDGSDTVAKKLFGKPYAELDNAQRGFVQRNIFQAEGQPNFVGAHFDEPNILAHVRFDERTDAEGKRVLFIEEIQSDWAQKGKREGFGLREEGRRFHVTDMSTGQRSAVSVTREEAERVLAEEQKAFPDRVLRIVPANSVGGLIGAPRAPFVTKTESWTALALKRMIRYAAENGFDRVAWTTGRQQADRYSLAKQVDRISYFKRVDYSTGEKTGETNVTIYTSPGTTASLQLAFGSDGVITKGREEFKGKNAIDVLGKEVLDKIEHGVGRETGAPEGSGELKGVNLEVGGEGMRAYYDRIVPNVANDVLKKLGGPRVGKVQVFDARGSGIYAYQIRTPYGLLHDNGITRYYDERDSQRILEQNPGWTREPRPQPQQQGFEITPELKAKVLGEGIPLFQKTSLEKQQGLPVVSGTRKGYFNQAYKHSQPVKVTWENGDSIYDAVKGLNEGHALWRARDNWPGAKVEAVSLEEVKKNDPESYREITRLRTYGIAQLPSSRVEMYRSMHDVELRQDAGQAKIKVGEDFGRTTMKPTRGQTAVLERAAGRLVKNGMAPALVREIPMNAHQTPGGSPALYNATLHHIAFREQMLNAAMAGEPGMDQWLPNAMSHEISHALDRGTKLGFNALVTPDIVRSFASARSPRFDYVANSATQFNGEIWAFQEDSLIPEGDIIGEAWKAFWEGPESVRMFLQYPFLAFPLEQDATIKTEVFAQLSALYHTSKAVMREHLPIAFKAMEEIYGKTTFAATAQAVSDTLQSRPAPSDRARVELRPTRGGRGGEVDVGGPPVGTSGPGMGQPPGARGGGPSLGQFDVADPTRWDELVRTFQDNKVDLKRLQAAIEKLNPLPEEQDAYLKDEARISRTSDKVNRARNEKFLPLVEAIRDAGLKLDEVESFLHARHAPEANAQIAKARRAAGQPATPGLAGMTNAEARRVIDGFRQNGKLAALRQIADRVDAIIKETRKIYVAGGLESQDTIDAWEQAYKYYVPLHREGFGEYAPAIGRGYTVRGAEAKRRVGSKLAVENILANIMAAHEAAIVRAEKNRVDRALWNLLEANPNPDFWRKGSPSLRQTIDVDTGLPVRVPDMNYKHQTNALVLKIDGKEKAILFNERNPRAMALAKALKNMQGSELSWWVAAWGQANRLLANLATAYNPVFWATNFVRDLGTTAFNLQSTELKGQEAKVMRMIPSALLGVRNELRGDGNSQWAQIYREAKTAGGMTGWMSTFESINDRAKEIVATLKKAERSKYDPRELGEKMLQVIKDYNDVVEHATRTAVYKAARDAGLSKDKAASVAKNITVNFNRKGTASAQIGALYMFFNANVQGTARMAAGALKSKRLWTYMVLAAGLSTALDVLNRLILADDDEDGENTYDKISDDIKARALIVMLPGTDGDYAKIPLPYGFNFVAAIGRVMGELATRKDYTPSQAAMILAKTATEAFSPFGQAVTPAQVLSPSLLDPVVYAMENKDWAGRPLYKEPELGRGPTIPASERGLRTTPLWAKSLAREIADATEGKIEINPGIVSSLVAGYTSGLGTTISQTYDFAQRAATGQEIPLASIPLVNRFAGEQTEGMRSKRFAELKKQALELDGDLRRLRKAGKNQEANELERAKPHLRAFLQAYKGEQKGLTTLYKEAEAAELEEMTRTERNEAAQDWERRRGEIYGRILRRTNQARP